MVTGRVVPEAERCAAPDCQSSRGSTSSWCEYHRNLAAIRRAQIAYAEQRRRWAERDAATAARFCTAHPSEDRDECRACEAIAEDAIQTGGGIDE